jgi:beta-glucosidase
MRNIYIYFKMRKLSILLLVAALFSACHSKLPVYKDASKPVEVRVKDLLKRMTLEEKLAQMQDLTFNQFSVNGVVDTLKMDSVLRGMSYGSIFGAKLSAEKLAQNISILKKYISRKNRLGIPVIFEAEALHGLIQDGTTVFPQSIALGSTFNPELVGRVAGAIASETQATGVTQVLAPDLDLARELRWGRVEETYGEDPYLVSEMGVAYVKAFNRHNIITTPKHFVAHGSPSGGLNLASVAGSERELYSLYLKPFARVIRETDPYSIMNAYSSYEAVPVTKSRKLLTDILREELGFKGYISSDWGSVDMLRHFHRTAKNKAEAAMQAVLAGVDVEVSGNNYTKLDSLVKAGVLPESEIDRCVARVLTAKFAMGLFDDTTTPDYKNLDKLIHTGQAIQLALEAARESAVLLKNANDILPLDTNKLRSIAVIGPNADQVQFGDYSWTNDNLHGVTPLQGIQKICGNRMRINYAKGCDLHSGDRGGFAEAVLAAQRSDVAILFVGAMSSYPGLPCPNAVSGESYDLSDIALTGVQEDLIKTVKATGKPVVVVLVAGKPSAMPWVKEHCDAVIVQWYAGEQEGTAIAEILFGLVNPSGKLNVSFPKSVGHLPVYYNYYPTDRGYYHTHGTPEKPGRDYVFSDPFPLWAFGTGLSYTSFDYLDMKVSGNLFTKDQTCTITVDVKNAGERDGKEVVQLYVRDKVSSVVTPVKELKRFSKVLIKAGETRQITFDLPIKELSLWNENMEEVVEPGEFELQVGTASDNILFSQTIKVVKD